MRVTLFLATILVACVFAEDEEYLPNLDGMQGIRIQCETPEIREFVLKYEGRPGFDFLNHGDDVLEVLITAGQANSFKDLLRKRNIPFTVFIGNVKETVIDEMMAQLTARKEAFLRNRFGADGFSFTYYPDYDEIESYVKEVEKNYNDVVTVTDIGSSYEGRSLYVVKISSGGENKPGILIDAGIHAREWIAPVTALYFIDQLAANKTNRYLLDNVDFYIIPILNPDGYQFTHSGIGNRFWRKTRSVSPNSQCRGVDANRNFEYGWMETGASSSPCAQTYAGPRPFSEPETRKLRDYVLANNNTFKLYLTFHSYGQYLLYPWGYTTKPAPNDLKLRSLAKSVAEVIYSVYGTRYTYGSSSVHLYPAAGGSDDWAMGAGGVELSYTIELPGGGRYGFDLPPDQIKRVGIETFEAIKFYTRYIELTYSSWIWV